MECSVYFITLESVSTVTSVVTCLLCHLQAVDGFSLILGLFKHFIFRPLLASSAGNSFLPHMGFLCNDLNGLGTID